MKTDVVQRWRDRRGTYRPAREAFDPRAFYVVELAADKEAKAFVEKHHYSGSYVAAVHRFGLMKRGSDELVGVAIANWPMNERSMAVLLQGANGLELGRLVLLDEVQANAESWFLARSLERLARAGIDALVSFSDPEPRQSASGHVVFAGHIGTCYQASNAVYFGRAIPRTLHLFGDGRVLSARSLQKLRARERGWLHVRDMLLDHGSAPYEPETHVEWVYKSVRATTRSSRHHGNHKYVLVADRTMRRHLPASLPYPKFSLIGSAMSELPDLGP